MGLPIPGTDDGHASPGESARLEGAKPGTSAPAMRVGDRLAAPVPVSESRIGMTADELARVEQVEESLRRRLADAEVITTLTHDGFRGPLYDHFADDLARYGLSVNGGWLATGHIFKLTARRGFNLHPDEELLHELATEQTLRTELAAMTVAAALPRFRERALIGGGWTPAGGASLTTYFMGACVFAFPNELRRHRTQQARWSRSSTAEVVYDTERGPITDPAVLAAGDDFVVDRLNKAKPRERRILVATLAGYTQEEMVEMFGETSARAIEGAVYRWRQIAQDDFEREGRS